MRKGTNLLRLTKQIELQRENDKPTIKTGDCQVNGVNQDIVVRLLTQLQSFIEDTDIE